MIGLPAAGSALVHGLWMAVAIVAGLAIFGWEIRRRKLFDERLWVIAGVSLALGAVASRLGTWFQELDPGRNASVLEWWIGGNRSVLAGLVGAWAGVLLGKRITGYPTSTGDLFAPAVALAMALGRVGCLLTEVPGKPTGGHWGISLTPEQAALLGGPSGVGLHPSFLYEIAFQLVAFAWLWRMRDRLPRSGDLFICYVAGYAVFRFGVEFVRANEEVWFGLTRPQWFLLATFPLLAWRVRRIWRTPTDAGPTMTAQPPELTRSSS